MKASRKVLTRLVLLLVYISLEGSAASVHNIPGHAVLSCSIGVGNGFDKALGPSCLIYWWKWVYWSSQLKPIYFSIALTGGRDGESETKRNNQQKVEQVSPNYCWQRCFPRSCFIYRVHMIHGKGWSCSVCFNHITSFSFRGLQTSKRRRAQRLSPAQKMALHVYCKQAARRPILSELSWEKVSQRRHDRRVSSVIS